MTRLTRIGGPTVLIQIDGWRLLADPTFEAPGRGDAFGLGPPGEGSTSSSRGDGWPEIGRPAEVG